MCLLPEHEDVSALLSTPKKVGCGGENLQSQSRERKMKEEELVGQTVSLNWWTPSSVRDTVSTSKT